LTCLEDSKAEDIVTIDLRSKTILADVRIIATGRSFTSGR
jgi:ribosome-associated protein